jgi:hypothetical protein
MSRFTAAVRFANILPGVILVAAFSLMSSTALYAVQPAAPQLLPYSVKVIAGGGTTAIPLTVGPGACAPSGNTPTTIWGDGCLATDLVLAGSRSAVADAYGNVFFTDYQTAATGADNTTGLIRRVDAVTGIVTTVAGGVLPYTASPSGTVGSPTVCATGSALTTTDKKGDGCLGTQILLAAPIGLVFSPAGDLYFAEIGSGTTTTNWPVAAKAIFGADVRKIAASTVAYGNNGCTNTSGCQMILTTGVVSMVDGALSSYTTYGYTANNYSASPACSASNLTNCIVAATQSYLDAPYGLAFDNSGNLYIAEEGKQAILVVNTTANTNTVAGVVIPAGTVAKIVGGTTAGLSTCPNGFTGTTGCNYPATGVSYTVGASANVSLIDNPYGVAVDPLGNVYFSDYYLYNVPEVAGSGSSAGDIYLYAGVQNTKGTITFPVTTRANNGSFAIGNPHGVAADGNSNVYITDATNGTIWRVDGAGQVAGTMTQPMYPVAGGVSTVCTTSIVPGVTTIDTYGDGCPGTGAKFGTGTTGGIFGVSVDAYSDLFVGDTVYPLVREVASGTQFGSIGANQPTDYVKIHFAAGDSPASSTPYQLTAGAANFSLGTASAACTTNSDTTQDCVLPIKATPSTTGAFTGMLEVMATHGGPAYFPLSGNYVATPFTRTVVSAVQQSISCTNTTAYNTSTPVTLTATLFSNGIGTPTGTVTFYANGTQIGTAQALANGTTATLTYTFTTAGSYAITSTYTPAAGSYYVGSSSLAYNITSAVPSLSGSTITYQLNTVSAGQTALYSLNIVQNVYAGTITFSCSGLPANSSCVFYPSSFTAVGCQTSNTVAMSILTQQATQTMTSSLGGSARGPWTALSILSGIGLALLIGVRRRRLSLRYSQIWMALAVLLAVAGIVSCNGMNQKTVAATPSGSYSVVVTETGSTSATFSFPAVTLTVH